MGRTGGGVHDHLQTTLTHEHGGRCPTWSRRGGAHIRTGRRERRCCRRVARVGGVAWCCLVYKAAPRHAADAGHASAASPLAATSPDMCAAATGPGGTTAPMFMSEGGLQMVMYPTTCSPHLRG